mmetsp:Transcript_36887/g.37544  ORF Transcript_36887/g.37544 Transcript_36887/m.37544 type:complete len:295 (+) Transcript_36887:132-1016(+)
MESTQASPTKVVLNTQWDPMESLHFRSPTGDCLRRIRKDLKTLFKDPLPGIFVVPDSDYATVIHAVIVGSFGTPYEGGFFYFILNCPDNYPHDPPKVKLITTGGGTVRFNPNLYANGKVCLSILGTWSGPGWSLVQSISSVLLSIQSLMNEQPFYNEPGYERADLIQVSNYNNYITHETIRIAVIEMVNKHSSLHQSIPLELQTIIQILFLNFIDSYQLTCQLNINKDGQNIQEPYHMTHGYFSYGVMLERIQTLQSDILESRLHEQDDDHIGVRDVTDRKGLKEEMKNSLAAK